MIITHKNTGTLGDFCATLPLISALKERESYIHLSLPDKYKQFNGLKSFLMYQSFIDEVDFLDKKGDIDIQAHQCKDRIPCRARYECKRLNIDIDENLTLNVKHIDIPKNKIGKPIVIDKNTPNNDRPIMKRCGLFPSENFIYLIFNKEFDINYNINLCLQNNLSVYSCLTGFGVLLQYFSDIDLNIVWFNRKDQEQFNIPYYEESRPFFDTYFPRSNIKLKYWRDI